MEENIILERVWQNLCPVCARNLDEIKKTEATIRLGYLDTSTNKSFEIEMCIKHDHTK